jgi:peptidoglycan/LPS O-acetylase OafA/YrhL
LTLDAWRGLAALAVFMYHRFLNRLPVGAGWMGVQLFFVISGYCIAAATDGAIGRELGFAPFMRRRLRRIAPPYLASCVLAIILRLWSSWRPILTEWGLYLQNFVMMQWVSITRAQLGGGPVPKSAFANPRLLVGAYWSLNYEEQFYLIAAALVALALWWRARMVTVVVVALTAAVAALNFARPGLVTGLFFDYWLQFACGVALYVRLCKLPSPRVRRWFDIGLLAALAVCAREAIRRGEISLDPHTFHFHGQLTFCVAFTCLLVVLRPFDQRMVRSLPGRALAGVGKFSYSLYLIHIPVVGMLYAVEKRLRPHIGDAGCDVIVVSTVLLASWVFYRLFERPFLNRPLADVAAVAEAEGETSGAKLDGQEAAAHP